MTKVKVSKKVADSLDYLLDIECYKDNYEHLMMSHASILSSKGDDSWSERANGINELSLLELANVLQNGYEAELTPEEDLVDYYNEMNLKYKLGLNLKNTKDTAFYNGVLVGVERALSKLNIKIEGINY